MSKIPASVLWPALKTWPKEAGKAPTVACLDMVRDQGYKPGTAVAMAIAMYLRPKGASQTEVQLATKADGPCRNIWRAAVAAQALRGGQPVTGASWKEQNTTRYCLAIMGKVITPPKAVAPKVKTAKAVTPKTKTATPKKAKAVKAKAAKPVVPKATVASTSPTATV